MQPQPCCLHTYCWCLYISMPCNPVSTLPALSTHRGNILLCCRLRHTAETFYSMAGHASGSLMMMGSLPTRPYQTVRCITPWHGLAGVSYSCLSYLTL